MTGVQTCALPICVPVTIHFYVSQSRYHDDHLIYAGVRIEKGKGFSIDVEKLTEMVKTVNEQLSSIKPYTDGKLESQFAVCYCNRRLVKRVYENDYSNKHSRDTYIRSWKLQNLPKSLGGDKDYSAYDYMTCLDTLKQSIEKISITRITYLFSELTGDSNSSKLINSIRCNFVENGRLISVVGTSGDYERLIMTRMRRMLSTFWENKSDPIKGTSDISMSDSISYSSIDITYLITDYRFE